MPGLEPVAIDTLDDVRLEPFRALPGRRRGSLAIAEGALPVQRACSSGFVVRDVLCTPSQVDAMRAHVRSPTRWWVASKGLLSELVGFSFHRGVLAAVEARVPSTTPPHRLGSLRERGCSLTAAAVGLTDPSNLGALIRAARGLGVDQVLVDAHAADAFARKSIRASAGHVFGQPLVGCDDVAAEVERLREGLDAAVLATTPAGSCSLRDAPRAGHRIVVFGAEGPGLDAAWLERADATISVPMRGGVDSLNVAAVSAVVFWALARPDGASAS